MMAESSHISFDSDKYSTLDEMYKEVSILTQILIKNDYEVLFRYEDCGIYVLEYCHSRFAELGTPSFEVCTLEELELLSEYRYNQNHDPEDD